ncbi:Zinc/iron permease [Syncephalis fuscata]|nr:Zinc/iron permease [Syncephalis fuscata]KAI9591865.1 Zinc/iron permease [Syncephalis fuscata]
MARFTSLLTLGAVALFALSVQAAEIHKLVRRHGAHGHGSAAEEADHAHEADGECGARLDLEHYDESLHIASVFIILVASGIGVFGALIAGRVKRLNAHEHVLNVFKHFGTGVILATGFIHMLPEAIEALTDKCLSSFNTNFSTWGPLFTMIAMLLLQLIEFMAGEQARRSQSRSHSHKHKTDDTKSATRGHRHSSSTTSAATPPLATEQSATIGDANTGTNQIVDQQAAQEAYIQQQHIHEHAHDEHEHANDELHDHHGHQHAHNHPDGRGHACHDVVALLDRDAQLRISTYILELGIALHSILIGMTLGVTTGSSYATLLVAIVFHQFFEGVALGSRIAEVTTGQRNGGGKMAYVLAAVFALITPIGMAIGMGIRSTYSPRSPSALLVRGIFDAFSAGVLIYMALVNLIAEEFTNCRKFHLRSWRVKTLYFAALYFGAMAMTIIGRWA